MLARQRVVLSAATIAVGLLTGGTFARGDTILADWTFNDSSGATAGYQYPAGNSGISRAPYGLPLDSVGGHNFQNYTASNDAGTLVPNSFGGNIGGASSTSSLFNGNGGFYGTDVGTNTLPTDNFAVEMHVYVNTVANETILFSSAGGTDGRAADRRRLERQLERVCNEWL